MYCSFSVKCCNYNLVCCSCPTALILLAEEEAQTILEVRMTKCYEERLFQVNPNSDLGFSVIFS